MRILHTVQMYDPVVGGSEEVVKQLSERLTSRGHQVTVATRPDPRRKSTVIKGVKVAEFDIRGNSVFGLHGNVAAYQEFLRRGQFDVMMNYAAQIWSTDIALPMLEVLSYKKVFVPCGYSGLYDVHYKQYFSKLPDYLKLYDRLIYLSPNYQDSKFGETHQLTNGVVIPNAASEDEFTSPTVGFRKKYGITTKYMLLSVANHYPAKGHGFVINSWKKLHRSDVTLVIIGDVHDRFPYLQSCYARCLLSARLNRNVKILSHVPRQDVVSAYADADIFVFGSSIECSPLVIFESMAAGTPFVTTNCGSVNDLASFGHIINSPTEMAETVNTLLNNQELRDSEGHKARQEWQRNYTWEHITDQYERLYRTLVK